MNIRLVYQDLEKIVGNDVLKNSDILKRGFDIGNSEIGYSSFNVSAIVYRLVCSNGLKSWRDEGVTSHRHSYFSDAEFLGIMNEAITNATTHAKEMIEVFERSKEIVVAKPFDKLQFISEKEDLSKKLTDKLYASFNAEPMNNMYGVINAVTRTARDATYLQKMKLETLADRILNDEEYFNFNHKDLSNLEISEEVMES